MVGTVVAGTIATATISNDEQNEESISEAASQNPPTKLDTIELSGMVFVWMAVILMGCILVVSIATKLKAHSK